MYRFLLFFVVLLFAWACSPRTAPRTTTTGFPVEAPVPPPPPPPLPEAPVLQAVPMDSSVRMGVLPNGLTYYIKANARPENRAELRLALKAGSMQEDEDQLGLAHFIEHMAFNGSTHFSKNELINYLEKAGSRFGPDLNAYTSFDETVYMLQVRTDAPGQLDTGLLILQDWASGVSFDSVEIEKERGVVISEWRSRLSAEQRMQNQYLPFLYYQSRYADRLPIGDPGIIQHASPATIRRYYRDWYRPELMAVMVVGTIDPDEIESRIRRQFGQLSAKGPLRSKAPATVPNHPETFIRVLSDPEATMTRIQLMYKHRQEKIRSLLDYRERLVESLYGRMISKRLSDLAEAPDPPFIAAFSNISPDVGDLATYSNLAIADAGKIRQAFATLLEETRRVQLHGFTEGELEREKANILRQAEQALAEESKSESGRVVRRMISHFLRDNPLPSARQHLDMYRSMMPTITTAEVSALADRYVTDRNRVVILTAPAKEAAHIPDSAALMNLLEAAGGWMPEPYTDVDLSAPLVRGEFPERPITGMHLDTLTGIHSWILSNGIQVRAKPTDFRNDEIIMNAYSPGGHSLVEDALYPAASLTSGTITASGIGSYKATDLSKKLAGKRVSVRPVIYERYEGFNGSSSVADLETMLQLVYGYVTDYRRDADILANQVNEQKTIFENARDNPNYWFGDRVARVTSRYHPRRGFPDPDFYKGIDIEQVSRIYADRFGDVSDMTFFFIGNFDLPTLQLLTSRYLGALPGGGRKESWADIGVRFPEGAIDSSYFMGEAPRSNVELIFHGPDHIHPDTAYLLTSLVDVARIKLRESLREDEGGVYGVGIYGSQSRYPVPEYEIRISFNTDPPRTKALIEAALDVVRGLKASVDPADIQKITEAQRQGRTKDLMQNGFWMSAMINSYFTEFPVDSYTSADRLEQRIALLNPERLSRMARKYFDEESLIRLVLHPAGVEAAKR